MAAEAVRNGPTIIVWGARRREAAEKAAARVVRQGEKLVYLGAFRGGAYGWEVA